MERAERQVQDRERRDRDAERGEEEEEPGLTAEEKHALKPKAPVRPEFSQYVTVRVVEEKTVTTVSPSNEELLGQSKSTETPHRGSISGRVICRGVVTPGIR